MKITVEAESIEELREALKALTPKEEAVKKVAKKDVKAEPAVAPEPVKEEEPAVAPEHEAPKVTKEEIRAVLREKQLAGKKEDVKALLKTYADTGKLSDVPEGAYTLLIESARAL